MGPTRCSPQGCLAHVVPKPPDNWNSPKISLCACASSHQFYMETEFTKSIVHCFYSGSFQSGAGHAPSPAFLGTPQHGLLAPPLVSSPSRDPGRGSSCSIEFSGLCRLSVAAEKRFPRWPRNPGSSYRPWPERGGPVNLLQQPDWLHVSPPGRDLGWYRLGQESQNFPDDWGRGTPSSSCHFHVFPKYLCNGPRGLSRGPPWGL